MAENRKAIKLIETHVGRVANQEFAAALGDFRSHAQKWEDMWRAVLNPDPSQAGALIGAGRLRTPPYPQALDGLLSGEVERVRTAAGF